MTLKERKENLRLFLEAKLSWPLKLLGAGGTVGGIYLGGKAIDVAAEKYKKSLAKKKKVPEDIEEGKGKALKILGKALAGGILTGATWTAGEKTLTTAAQVRKREKLIRDIAALRQAQKKT